MNTFAVLLVIFSTWALASVLFSGPVGKRLKRARTMQADVEAMMDEYEKQHLPSHYPGLQVSARATLPAGLEEEGEGAIFDGDMRYATRAIIPGRENPDHSVVWGCLEGAYRSGTWFGHLVATVEDYEAAMLWLREGKLKHDEYN